MKAVNVLVSLLYTLWILTACQSTSVPAATPPPERWSTYTSPEYGFSIEHPADFEIHPGATSETLYIGEQIHVWVSDIDPAEFRGDGPFVESSEPATVSGLDATRMTGYIGAVGGNIPQQFVRYLLQRDGRHYIFTLYALSFKAASDDAGTIRPLHENDVALFEEIMGTLKFEQ